MKQLHVLILIFILNIGTAFSQDDKNYCGLNAPQPDEYIPSDGVSGNYWTNMLDDHTVMFTAEGGTSGEYQAYDLNEKKAYKLTDEIDPFPVPDGRRIYIHPGPLQFFNYDEILKKVANGADQSELVETDGHSPRRDNRLRKPLIDIAKEISAVDEKIDVLEEIDEKDMSPAQVKEHARLVQKSDDLEEKKDHLEEKLVNKIERKNERHNDEDDIVEKDFEYGDKNGQMWGYYESIGVLKTKNNGLQNFSKYRVLTGEGEGTFKDYKVRFNKDGTIKKVTSPSSAKLMCPNFRKDGSKVDLDFDTPIMSPKADEFAITDRNTNTTKIISFDPASGNCKVALDLGFEAGKVHFSPDGSKIAFHTQSLNVGDITSTSPNNRGYVLDRKANTLQSLKVGENDDKTAEQYPVFMSDGRILYQRVKYDPATGKQSRAWVKVDLNKINKANFAKVTEGDCQIDKNLPLLAIGKLYSEICNDAGNAMDPLMWTLNMDPEKCQNLVSHEWETQKSKIMDQLKSASGEKANFSTLSKETLIAACPDKKQSEKIIKDGEGEKMKYPAIVGERCIVCHVPGSPRGYIPFDKPEELRKMKAFGKSAENNGPYAGKTFLEQISDILEKNMEGKTPPAGVPRVPADGARLKNSEIKEILQWVSTGKEVK